MSTVLKNQNQWGGSRNGAGRKPTQSKKHKISISLDCALIEKMEALPKNRSAIIEEAVRLYLSGRNNRNSEKSVVFLEQNFEDAMIDLILQIEPKAPSSAPVSIPKLWQKAESFGWSRGVFENTLFGLAKEYRIFLHRHAHELQASESLKKAAIRGENGDLYIGLVLSPEV